MILNVNTYIFFYSEIVNIITKLKGGVVMYCEPSIINTYHIRSTANFIPNKIHEHCHTHRHDKPNKETQSILF